jgi:parvulin-like peptidyl-prolyl isomerase
MIQSGIVLLTLLMVFGPPARSNQPSADCNIVARVNNDVITREASSAKLGEYREDLERQMRHHGRKVDDINSAFARTKSSVLDQMIDDLLLDQRAAALALESDAEVIKVVNDQGSGIRPGVVHTLPAEALARAAIDWDEARSTFRKNVLRDAVVDREVILPIYESVTDADRRDYYDNHKDEFKLAGKATLSEVFLPFANRSETQTELDAFRLQLELARGANFAKAVLDNTPPSRPSRARGGIVGSFLVRDLRPGVATAIAALKPGEISEPVRFDDGYAIYRVDAITPDSLMDYADPGVQEKISRSITMSLAEVARKQYLVRLRNDADIEVCPGIR